MFDSAELVASSAPRSPDAHLVETQLFLANGSRLFDLDKRTASDFRSAIDASDGAGLQELLERFDLDLEPAISPDPLPSHPVRALSLAISQTCNLGCSYCYAQGGDFGGPRKLMDEQVAFAAIDLLLADVAPGQRANLAFLGGEPLAARAPLRAATRYAADQAASRGIKLGFSLTTNGTLLTTDDAQFFEEHRFAVTVSLDGTQAAHDRLRPFKGGAGSFARIIDRVTPLLARQQRMQVSARVTVTPRNLDLVETMETFIGMGFHSVGFSPMLTSPGGDQTMDRAALHAMLGEMIACADLFETRTRDGKRYPFANALNALREIHRGTHRPYPCGAGAGYLGVSAEGELAACHRFVGDEAGAMGNLAEGVDAESQRRWLSDRHVDRQQPCRQCWARYLCGGGCHHETLAVGRTSCDYIRGWLHHCLGLYGRLSREEPDALASIL